MNIRIAIIDDRQEDCNEIERLLLEWADSSYHDVTIKKFTDPIKVLNKTKADEFNYDLLFLDIKMPTYNGIDLIREIQRSQPSILFILVSSENSYAEKGYSVYAFDFIPKPIRLARVVGAMERAQGKLNISKLKPLVLQQDDRVERFEWADIIYIKSIVNNIEIHLVNNETITYRATLKSIALQAPEYFIKTTRNALVNITRVKSFTYDAITFIGSSEIIPMSKSAYESVYRAFAKFN